MKCNSCNYDYHEDEDGNTLNGDYPFHHINGAFVFEHSFKYGWESTNFDIAGCPKCGNIQIDFNGELNKYRSMKF